MKSQKGSFQTNVAAEEKSPLSLHETIKAELQGNQAGRKAHLRITDNEIRVIILDNFQPVWDFAGVLHTGKSKY